MALKLCIRWAEYNHRVYIDTIRQIVISYRHIKESFCCVLSAVRTAAQWAQEIFALLCAPVTLSPTLAYLNEPTLVLRSQLGCVSANIKYWLRAHARLLQIGKQSHKHQYNPLLFVLALA